MKHFEYQKDRFINLDHVVSFSYELIPLSADLSDGDIYEVELRVILVTGSATVFSDYRSVREFVRRVFHNNNTVIQGTYDKDLSYYVHKYSEYKEAVKSNKEGV